MSWAVVYGAHGIELDSGLTKAEAEHAAALLNKQAPQYDHRAEEVGNEQKRQDESRVRRVRRGNA